VSADPSPLISVADLAARLGQAGVVVLDATLYLPHEGKNAHQEYLSAHIPGARFFDIDGFGDRDTSLPHMVPAAGRFANLAGALGIGPDTFVVAYDQRGVFSAGRAWWLLRLFGHENAAVLDGGLPAWAAAGQAIETGEPPPAQPLVFRPALRTRRWRGLGDMQDNLLTQKEIVLDARSAARFDATEAERRPGLRSGHIPGAVNLPFTDLIGPDRRLLPPEALRRAFAARGVDGTRPVVTSCGSGVTATVLTLAMMVAGLPEGAVYDGSWTEWGGQPDTPVET
jgi:thiosulfate/3-mercaptopyruvate sulfurtransferase